MKWGFSRFFADFALMFFLLHLMYLFHCKAVLDFFCMIVLVPPDFFFVGFFNFILFGRNF